MFSSTKYPFAIATSVGRLSSVELIPVSVTLSIGGFGVAETLAVLVATAAVDDAAGVCGATHAVTTRPRMRTSAAERVERTVRPPLIAEDRGWTPAEETAF